MKTATLELELEGRDEPITVGVDGRDIRRVEAFTDTSFISADVSYTNMTLLGGFAAIRQGKYDGSIETFLDLCTNVSEVSNEEDFTATKKERGGGSA